MKVNYVRNSELELIEVIAETDFEQSVLQSMFRAKHEKSHIQSCLLDSGDGYSFRKVVDKDE